MIGRKRERGRRKGREGEGACEMVEQRECGASEEVLDIKSASNI